MAERNEILPSCACHMMEVLSETSSYPVTFDNDRGAFFLCDRIAIRYCMSCGGTLPVAQYGSPVDPNPEDEKDALAIVESASSLEDLFGEIGKPDELVSASDLDSTGFVTAMRCVHDRYPDIYDNAPESQWTRYARYARKWPSLCLDVYEYPDGRLEPSVTGLGPNQFVIIERRSWWSRLLPRRTKAT